MIADGRPSKPVGGRPEEVGDIGCDARSTVPLLPLLPLMLLSVSAPMVVTEAGAANDGRGGDKTRARLLDMAMLVSTTALMSGTALGLIGTMCPWIFANLKRCVGDTV